MGWGLGRRGEGRRGEEMGGDGRGGGEGREKRNGMGGALRSCLEVVPEEVIKKKIPMGS